MASPKEVSFSAVREVGSAAVQVCGRLGTAGSQDVLTCSLGVLPSVHFLLTYGVTGTLLNSSGAGLIGVREQRFNNKHRTRCLKKFPRSQDQKEHENGF